MTENPVSAVDNTCPICEYSTLRPSDFKRHLLIHTGARPFICAFCGKVKSLFRNGENKEIKISGLNTVYSKRSPEFSLFKKTSQSPYTRSSIPETQPCISGMRSSVSEMQPYVSEIKYSGSNTQPYVSEMRSVSGETFISTSLTEIEVPIVDDLETGLPTDVNLPVMNDYDLWHINGKLREDEHFRRLLIQYLYQAGKGDSALSFTSSLLKALFVRDIAIQYSRFGKKGKKPFANLVELSNIITGMVSQKFPIMNKREIGERLSRALALGTAILQKSCRHLPFHSAKLEIKGTFKQPFHHVTYLADDDKSWSVLLGSQCVPDSPPTAAVAMFRLSTGHDCLSAYLFRFNIINSPICVLCDSGSTMTAAHMANVLL
ncbi:uncharacterized protein NPIL_658561 [Nephila pilipes]|uniref:C2H2-type domain-containing protein n=1 Tax=Nephila pilipes TaxID=299642 RepID=A0A8X6NZW5_NEPPI|nr:uncharacterized protein NPIL_658561 [Nephila pilipes]